MTYIGSLQGSPTGATSGSSSSMAINPGGGISGLSSGINTDAIVSGLVGAAQVPLVHVLQQRQVLQWQQEQYQQVNSSLSTLQNSVSPLQLQSTFLQQNVTSSNTSVATATGSPAGAGGTFNVDVNQLAQSATVYSSSTLSKDGSNFASKTLSELGYSSGITLNVNGQSQQFQKTDTIASVLQAISGNTSVGVTGFYDSNSGKVVLQTTGTGSGSMIRTDTTTADFLKNTLNIATPADVTSGLSTGSSITTAETLHINGQRIQVGSGSQVTTEAQLKDAINNLTSKTGVTADDSSGKLVLKAASTLISPISVSDPNNLFQFASTTPQDQVAQDASYTINGFTSTSPTNTASYNGMSLGLTGKGSTTLTSSIDTQSVVKAITDFVKQYNTTLQVMQHYYTQKRDLSYQPLTSDQASQMTQDQIGKWNQKAQTGLLGNDMLLGSVMNSVENASTTMLNGQPSSTLNGKAVTLNSLGSIGIQPIDPLKGVDSGSTAPGVTTTGWGSYGLLEINTQKLTQAVQQDPQAVMRLFTNEPGLSGNVSTMDKGIAVQMYDTLQNQVQQLTTQTGAPPSNTTVDTSQILPSTPLDPNADFKTEFGIDSLDTSSFGHQISSLDSEATDLQTQVDSLRSRYQKEFSNMEGILSGLSSQSGYLAGLSGVGSSSSGG